MRAATSHAPPPAANDGPALVKAPLRLDLELGRAAEILTRLKSELATRISLARAEALAEEYDLARLVTAGRMVSDDAGEIAVRLAAAYALAYRDTPRAKTGPKAITANVGGNSGKEAAARRLGLSPQDLRRWRPLADRLERGTLDAKIDAVRHKEGDAKPREGVTITSVLRHCTNHSLQPGYDSDAFYTPVEVLDLVRDLFGGTIDLDPASCEAANDLVRARKFFTVEDDGAKQPWFGKVFCNPPYSRERVGPFVEHAIAEFDANRCTELALLVHANTDAQFYQTLARDYPACLFEGRLQFIPAQGDPKHHSTRGSAIFYLGPNVRRFAELFGRHGALVAPLVIVPDP